MSIRITVGSHPRQDKFETFVRTGRLHREIALALESRRVVQMISKDGLIPAPGRRVVVANDDEIGKVASQRIGHLLIPGRGVIVIV
jgi:hypothetical protein